MDMNQIRKNPRGYREPDGSVRLLPICDWCGREYALVSKLTLTTDMQRVEVIDLTDLDINHAGGDAEIFEHIRPARLNATQPEMETYPEAWLHDNETLEAFQARTRRHVMVVFPDEGHTSILDNSGSWRWVSLADLPVRMVPGTVEDREEIRMNQMDELEQHVDAGGAIGL